MNRKNELTREPYLSSIDEARREYEQADAVYRLAAQRYMAALTSALSYLDGGNYRTQKWAES